MNDRLERDFYSQDTIKVARNLLGKTLVRKIGRNIISGIITETEAYRQSDDPASHAYRDVTPRNHAMFEQVGHAYVYFTYGMYHCMNAVAKSRQYRAGAVLIRALKPQLGINTMMKNRRTKDLKNLANGPAKLAIALDITKKQYGEDLVESDSLFITYGIDKQKITAGPRVGIKVGTDKLWNFKIDI